jgi:hypothetical protein
VWTETVQHTMLSIVELPAEILEQIIRWSNLNGDLVRLRLSSSGFLDCASQGNRLLLNDLCSRYNLSHRAVNLYRAQLQGGDVARTVTPSEILHALRLASVLKRTTVLVNDATHATSHLSAQQLLLFEVFSKALSLAPTVAHSTASDVLVPSPGAEQIFWRQLPKNFSHLLRHELTLQELEDIIGTISLCVMKLWTAVFMFRPKTSAISSFGGLTGVSFNTDQAVLMEHVIWRGPLWVAQVLRLQCPSLGEFREDGCRQSVDERLANEGIWNGTRQEAARLVANGVARLLWKERQLRIERVSERRQHEAVPLTGD